MNGRTVLIADDEPHVRHMLSFKLRGAGFRILTARCGDEAWEVARKHTPDVIISDLQMGQVDGLGLCRLLADEERTSRIPVILLTSRGHRLTEAELADVNIVQVMAKPFSARELVRTVCGLLGLNERGEERGAHAA